LEFLRGHLALHTPSIKKGKTTKNANEDVNIILLRQGSLKKPSEYRDTEHINKLK